MWITLAIFNLSGNMPVLRDKFIIWVKGSIIYAIVSFTSLVDMSSCPQLILGLSLCTISKTWECSMLSRNILLGRGFFQKFRITFARLGYILAGSNANFGKIFIK